MTRFSGVRENQSGVVPLCSWKNGLLFLIYLAGNQSEKEKKENPVSI